MAPRRMHATLERLSLAELEDLHSRLLLAVVRGHGIAAARQPRALGVAVGDGARAGGGVSG